MISYLAFSIPAVVAGIAATNVGLHETSVVYSAAVIAFSALVLAAQRLRTGMRGARNTGQCGRPATAHH